jgi:hypothetical protein
MSYKNISYNLTNEQVAAVKASIDAIYENLPFLVSSLSKQEQKHLNHRGNDRNTELVADALHVVANHPEIMPGSFNIPEFQSDDNLYEKLHGLHMQLISLLDEITLTKKILGSEIMEAVKRVYDCVKKEQHTNAALKAMYIKMSARYKKSARKTNGQSES